MCQAPFKHFMHNNSCKCNNQISWSVSLLCRWGRWGPERSLTCSQDRGSEGRLVWFPHESDEDVPRREALSPPCVWKVWGTVCHCSLPLPLMVHSEVGQRKHIPLWRYTYQGLNSSSPLTSSVTSGSSFTSRSWFLHLKNGDSHSSLLLFTCMSTAVASGKAGTQMLRCPPGEFSRVCIIV